MVRALLAGTKTQTRREVKPEIQHIADGPRNGKWYFRRPDGVLNSFETREELAVRHCPYGKPGERLWVKETHQMGFSTHVSDCGYLYRATDVGKTSHHGVYCYEKAGKYFDHYDKPFVWRPSIFMRRVASRILLEIVSVRVERLQAISEADAVAEGIQDVFGGWRNYIDGSKHFSQPSYEVAGVVMPAAVISYATLWESINGEDSWEANPWVWRIEFKRVEA